MRGRISVDPLLNLPPPFCCIVSVESCENNKNPNSPFFQVLLEKKVWEFLFCLSQAFPLLVYLSQERKFSVLVIFSIAQERIKRNLQDSPVKFAKFSTDKILRTFFYFASCLIFMKISKIIKLINLFFRQIKPVFLFVIILLLSDSCPTSAAL